MKGFVYRIYDNTNGNVYYGSTTERYVSNRICKHRKKYKGWLKGCKGEYFCKSYDIIKNNDYSYNIVEEVEIENKYELRNRERYYIENNECVNKYIPNRTKEEWIEVNKDKIQEQKKEYYEKNKDKIQEQKKEYREKNKDKIKQRDKQYCEKNKDKKKEYDKQYREKNKDKKKEYQREYCEKNKDKINEKITCECGCVIVRRYLNKHKKTKKHLKLI